MGRDDVVLQRSFLSVMLDQDLLDQLERRWRDNDAAILRWLQPGLTDERIDELTAPLGIRLPEEARRWWRWHDGVPMDAPPGSHSIGGGPTYIPLSYAVENTMWLAEGDPSWPTGWLVMTADSDPLIMDCGAGFDEPVRVHCANIQDPGRPPVDHDATSIGELVSLWIEAIDCGVYTYNKEVGDWELHQNRMPPHMRGRGLV